MKRIEEFPNYYITKDGRIWSAVNTRYHKPRWLKNILGKNGYLYVNLLKNGERHVRYIHRLLLENFIGSSNCLECRHLNGIRIDNNLENLKWGTRKENAEDAIKHGTLKGGNGRKGSEVNTAKLTEQEVRIIIYMYRTKEFTMREIAKVYTISPTQVCDIVNKKTWKHLWRK